LHRSADNPGPGWPEKGFGQMNYRAMVRAGREPISTPGSRRRRRRRGQECANSGPAEALFSAAPGPGNASIVAGAAGLIAERSFAPWALPARSHACCFADIFGTWDFAAWLTGNQLDLRPDAHSRRAWPARALLLVPSRYAVARGGRKPHSRLRPEPRWANVGVSHAR
jgi:hypothetical protein